MKKLLTSTVLAAAIAVVGTSAIAENTLNRVTPACQSKGTFCITAVIAERITLAELVAEARRTVRSFSIENGFKEPLNGTEIIQAGDFKFRL